MANRWRNSGNSGRLYFFGLQKITADGDCSPEIKRHLLLGRKVMSNLNSILKSREVTLPTKVRLVKALVFPVVMYGCESWTIKKAEPRRTDAFDLWCWRRWESLSADPCTEMKAIKHTVIWGQAHGFGEPFVTWNWAENRKQKRQWVKLTNYTQLWPQLDRKSVV